MQIFVHKHMCIHIHSRYADKCFMTDFLGGKSHFIVFSGFHDINIPPCLSHVTSLMSQD